MPIQAHDKIFNAIKEACSDALHSIFDDLDDGMWQAYDADDQITEGEWKSRDGFWSKNNGNVAFCIPGNAIGLHASGHDNPYIQKFIDSIDSDIVDAAKQLDDCPKDLPNDELVAWMNDNHPDETDRVIEGADEYPPFVKSSFCLKGTDGYQFDGEVTDDTRLSLFFSFAYNDDFGYGRPWCQGGYYGKVGFGDRDVVLMEFVFTPKDLEWLKEQIARMPEQVKCTPDYTYVTTVETVMAPGLA